MAKSHMERYIFLVKVLLSAGNFCWPNEILQVKGEKTWIIKKNQGV